jgi:uncharacterized protein (TIGR02271 family)
MSTDTTQAYDWQGRTLKDRSGDEIGTIDALYVDQQTDKPEWALVNTGLFGSQSSFVPLAGASPQGDDVVANVDVQQVKDAPKMSPEENLSEEQEAELFRHYGVDYTEQGSVTATGEPSSPTDGAMTRSEEELRVGKMERERGRARLRKFVVTEQVETTVPVRREEVRLEREPITDANVDEALAGPEISEEEHEVVLHEEQPVVEKRTVPKERVRMEKDSVTEEAHVSEEIRKEQIEADGDVNP